MSEEVKNTGIEQIKQISNPSKRVCLSVEGEPQISPEVLQEMGLGIMRDRLDIDRDFN